MRSVFDLITLPFSLFENQLYNYLAMALIGAISYRIAFWSVGELGLKRRAGSDAHWIIRFIVFVTIWLICCIAIKIVTFIINNWLIVIISGIMLLLVYIVKKYAEAHPDCILNRKIF